MWRGCGFPQCTRRCLGRRKKMCTPSSFCSNCSSSCYISNISSNPRGYRLLAAADGCARQRLLTAGCRLHTPTTAVSGGTRHLPRAISPNSEPSYKRLLPCITSRMWSLVHQPLMRFCSPKHRNTVERASMQDTGQGMTTRCPRFLISQPPQDTEVHQDKIALGMESVTVVSPFEPC